MVNLDPANEPSSRLEGYEAAVDIEDLVKLDEVMDELKLGPNGGEKGGLACRSCRGVLALTVVLCCVRGWCVAGSHGVLHGAVGGEFRLAAGAVT